MKYSGAWNDNNEYAHYQLDSIAMKEIEKYDELLQLIVNQLSIDLNFKLVKTELKLALVVKD